MPYLLTQDELEKVVDLARQSERADINANQCNTRSDHRAAYQAQEDLEEYLDRLPKVRAPEIRKGERRGA